MVNGERYVAGYRNISISDDFGNYMSVGDIVEVLVMPFDYISDGELIFCEEQCVFFVNTRYGRISLSHYDECHDMGATIKVTKTFKWKEKKHI